MSFLEFFPKNPEQKTQLLSTLQKNLRHSSFITIQLLMLDMNVAKLLFSIIRQMNMKIYTEPQQNWSLPLYYIENENEQNEKFKNLKGPLITNTISKELY